MGRGPRTLGEHRAVHREGRVHVVTKIPHRLRCGAGPTTPSRSALLSLVSAAGSPRPLQACNPPPRGLEGTLERGIRLGRSLDMVPECTLELHLAASCLKMEGRD